MQSAQWSGFYGGIHAGAVDSRTALRDEDGTIFNAEGGTYFTHDLTGMFGIHGGYNWQFGNRVFGIEADYSWTDSSRGVLFDGVDQFGERDLNGFGSVRGRVGLAQDNAFLYLTGGLGYVDLRIAGADASPGGSDTYVADEDFLAFVAGAGAAFKLRSDLSLRLEYLRYMLDESDTNCTACTPGDNQYFGGGLNMLRAGLTYHPGAGHGEPVMHGGNAWTGFYIGGHVGAVDTSTGVLDEDFAVLREVGMTVFSNGIDMSGGVHGGYNWAVGSAIVGVEADYTWTDAEFSRVYGNRNVELNSRIDAIASLRGRLGVAAGNALVYVTGGGAWIDADIHASYTVLDVAASFDGFAALVMGAGGEVKLTPNISLRGEYLYYAFADESTVCPNCNNGQPQIADGEIHSFRAGLSYYLNSGGAVTSEVAVADWSGAYAGLHVGATNSVTGIRDEDGTLFSSGGITVFSPSSDISGGIYGGYNFQMGNAILGVEADYTFVDADNTRLFNGGDHFKSSRIDGFGSMRGRVGLAAGDAMVFATGGVGFVQADITGWDSLPDEVVNYDDFMALVAGAGTELKLHDDWSVRLEYLYYGFDEQSDRCNNCPNGDAFADGQLHTLRLGLTRSF